MGKNIKNSGSGSSKNIRNDDSLKLSTLKVIDATITNATITNLTNTELQTATSDIIDLENNKQDIITDSTDIELNELEVNDKIKFQFGTTDDEKTLIQRGDANGKLKFTANNVFFHDDTDTEVFAIKNNGDLNCFDNSIDNVADIDFNGSSLITQLTAKQDILTAGNGIDIVSSTISVDEAELTTKQDILTAGNGIDIVGSTISVDEAELTSKQDLITDSTDIELNRLDINDAIYFQRSNSSDDNTNISRSNSGGKMKFVGNTYVFRDSADSQNIININNSGTLTAVSLQADFFSSITDTELDFLDGATSNIQNQIDSKQDTLTSSSNISVASIDLNNGNLTNGGTGNFSSINLSGSDLQGKIDDKADIFGVNLPLELDSLAIPNPALKLNFNSTQFELDGDELKFTGNMGTMSVSGITSLSVQSIELHNSTSLVSFLDFGGGDFRFRQLYNQSSNTFTFSIDDATGANPESKMVITRTEVQIENANLNLNTNDIIGTNYIQSATNIRFYTDGDTTGGANYIMDLKANGDIDFNDGSLIDVEAISTSDYPNTAILRMASFNTPNTNSTSSGLYGSDSYLNSFSTAVGTDLEIELGSSFVSSDTGIFTIDEAGTFKITCTINGDNASVNDRVVLGFYISKNNDTSAWQSRADQFGMMYLRDDNFGQGGSCSFTSIRTLALNDTIRIKTKFGQGGNDWQETRDDGDIDVWANITFEKLF